MSIARVRIAPMERWCEETRQHPNAMKFAHLFRTLPGREVLIDSGTMARWNQPDAPWFNPNACSGRYWDLIPGQPFMGDAKVICEHMLEMD